jgi:anaerobic magnesium-protoporphyrin IX monomethyl ester cyclase
VRRLGSLQKEMTEQVPTSSRRLKRRVSSHDVVILVNSPRHRALNAKATGLYPQLGIRALESYLAAKVPWVKVVCLDGEVLTDAEISQCMSTVLREAENPILGLSTILGNYANSLDIARKAKEINPYVLTVMGGPWATELPLSILSTAEDVDLVMRGDGEEALRELIVGTPPTQISGLAVKGTVTAPDRTLVALEELPWPLARLTTLEPYFKNFARIYPRQPFKPAPIYFKKFGCDQRCPYCAIPKAPMRPRSPDGAWHEVIDVGSRLNANHFWDVADNADLSFWREFAQLASKYNPHGEITFFTFISAERVTREFVETFRRAGGIKVFIGFDSNNPDTLRRVKAGRATVEDNERAIKLVKAAGLYLDASFILGLPHETQKSFTNTQRFIIEKVAPYDRLTLLLVPILTLIPGTHYWRRYFLGNPTLRRKY